VTGCRRHYPVYHTHNSCQAPQNVLTSEGEEILSIAVRMYCFKSVFSMKIESPTSVDWGFVQPKLEGDDLARQILLCRVAVARNDAVCFHAAVFPGAAVRSGNDDAGAERRCDVVAEARDLDVLRDLEGVDGRHGISDALGDQVFTAARSRGLRRGMVHAFSLLDGAADGGCHRYDKYTTPTILVKYLQMCCFESSFQCCIYTPSEQTL
jgi:hypothetical protein